MTLKNLLFKQIWQSGPISFEEYMSQCLYHPEFGYYTSGTARIGKSGDFYSNPSVHALYGWMIADYFLRTLAPIEGTLVVLELGGGEGQFARDFLDFVAAEKPDSLPRLSYFILEQSPALRTRQEATLGDSRARVEWLTGLQELQPFQGLVFANEFYDAFPVRRFRFSSGRWKEIFVGEKDSQLVEVETPVASVPPIAPASPQEGDEFEVSDARSHHLTSLLPLWTRGLFLILDYGAEQPRLVQRFARGTVLAYRSHQAGEDLYADPGDQDLTAHVDFTALQQVFRQDSDVLFKFLSQSEFLLNAGIFDLVKRLNFATSGLSGIRLHAAMKTLVNPEGMGTTFHVLAARKRV
ncbi:MAG: class I SAM-dependent methyltransferase [bacterium]